jgi:hypothetical protein
MSLLPFEIVRVKWLMPVTVQWVSSCVASVYYSDVCVRNASISSRGINSSEGSSVSTGCPDVPRVNLHTIESAGDFNGPSDASSENELACFSEWQCVCVRVEVDLPDAIGVVHNGSHGAAAVGNVVSMGRVERAWVRCGGGGGGGGGGCGGDNGGDVK